MEEKKEKLSKEAKERLLKKARMVRATYRAVKLLKERRKESASKEAQNPNEVEGEEGAGQVRSEEQ